MTSECRTCLRRAFLNCVGLCSGCDDRMKDAFPEGLVAVPVAVIRDLQATGAKVQAEIDKSTALIEDMRRDLQATRGRR